MINTVSRPKQGENVWIWLLKILTGVLVFTLLIVHLVVNHFTAKEGLMTYSDVVAYLSNPWIAFMEIAFLTIVVSHSLFGTRSIILDLYPSEGLRRVLDWVFVLLGFSAIIYGIWLTRIIVSRGAGG